MNSKEINTSRRKGITDLYKDIKYKSIENQMMFDEAMEYLNTDKYTSFQAEKKRSVYKKFSIKIYKRKDDTMKVFERLSLSFINMFKKTISFSDIEKLSSIKTDENFIKMEMIPEDMFFRTTYIENDTVYLDEFHILPKKHYFVLSVRKVIKLPITRDPMSQYTYLSGWDMRKQWKRYKNEILKGIYS